jgi:hypothetical protein
LYCASFHPFIYFPGEFQQRFLPGFQQSGTKTCGLNTLSVFSGRSRSLYPVLFRKQEKVVVNLLGQYAGLSSRFWIESFNKMSLKVPGTGILSPGKFLSPAIAIYENRTFSLLTP